MAVVKYTNVEIRQDSQIVLSDITLGIEPGEMVYLLGKVGTGKTSFLKTLYGALEVSAGEAIVLDQDMSRISRSQLPYLRRRIGIVFQDYRLLTDRNVEENLRFVLKATGWKDSNRIKAHIAEVLEQVGMKGKQYRMPHELSGGEQQRVVIARALLNSPELIIADEPTGNLDYETGNEIMTLLYSLSQAGIAVIMSTHNQDWPRLYPGRNLNFENQGIF